VVAQEERLAARRAKSLEVGATASKASQSSVKDGNSVLCGLYKCTALTSPSVILMVEVCIDTGNNNNNNLFLIKRNIHQYNKCSKRCTIKN
jgi:hypothetical protein